MIDTALEKAILLLRSDEADYVARHAAVVQKLKTEEERKKALQAEMDSLNDARRAATLDAADIRRDLAERLQDVQALLGRHTPLARQMLRKLLDGKITAEPLVEESRRGFRLAGRLNVGHLRQREVFTMFERDNVPPLVTAKRWWPQRD